jgi:hypothetical protein
LRHSIAAFVIAAYDMLKVVSNMVIIEEACNGAIFKQKK